MKLEALVSVLAAFQRKEDWYTFGVGCFRILKLCPKLKEVFKYGFKFNFICPLASTPIDTIFKANLVW